MSFKSEYKSRPPQPTNHPILHLLDLRVEPPLQLVHPQPLKFVHARLEPVQALVPHLLVYDDVLRAEYLLLKSVNQGQALVVVLVVQDLDGYAPAAAGVSRVFVGFVDNCAVL